MSMESISSTKSGLPSAAPAIRALTSLASSASPTRFAISCVHSSSESGSSRIDVAFSLPPPQPGRASSSSGRARQTSRIGTSARPVGEVLDEVEERRLAPVDVVEDDDEGPPAVRVPRRTCERRRSLIDAASGLDKPDHVGHPLGDELGVVLVPRGARRAATAPARASRSSSSPATSLIASSSGQYVMPSP